MSRSVKILCVISTCILVIAMTQGQDADWRHAWGEPRASTIEALCRALFPDAHLKWGQHLSLLRADRTTVQLNIPGYEQRELGNEWQGVTGLELGLGKADFLSRAQTFQSGQPQHFKTEIIAFRASSNLEITDYRRFELDPDEAIKEITEMYIQAWPSGQWPILTATYHSYYFGVNSVGSIMWHATIDANSGSVRAKVPIAIMKKHRDGSSQEDYLSVKRINASQIEVTGGLTGKTFKYSCAQICAINGQSLFDSW